MAASVHTTAPAAPAIDLDTAPRWMLSPHAAQAVGVSDRTIRRWARMGLIRVSRPTGGRVLVDRDSLRKLIEDAAV